MMLGQPWWYWLAFAAVILIVLIVPLSALLAWREEHLDEIDRELWSRIPGATR